MDFVKMHGLGNDFVLLGEAAKNPAALSRRLCDRHFGIGADGLIFVTPSEGADFRMRIFNPDGSEPEMCGNGIRCAAKYYVERRMEGQRDGEFELSVETLAGKRLVTIARSADGQVEKVTVDMGEPILEPREIPARMDGERALDRPLDVDGEQFTVSCVSMGNPHCIIFGDSDPKTIDVPETGSKIENHPAFPNRTNVEFAWAKSREEVVVRVWERGAGETLACGTGACATAVAGGLTGRLGERVAVRLPGGALDIRWAGSGPVFMTGPAVEVFSGSIQV
ncbi:MAG: diaminopimelate epimerase [bacterium]